MINLFSAELNRVACKTTSNRVTIHNGMWRSLVARYLGEVEVTGSNPVIPTTNQRDLRWFSLLSADFTTWTVRRRG